MRTLFIIGIILNAVFFVYQRQNPIVNEKIVYLKKPAPALLKKEECIVKNINDPNSPVAAPSVLSQDDDHVSNTESSDPVMDTAKILNETSNKKFKFRPNSLEEIVSKCEINGGFECAYIDGELPQDELSEIEEYNLKAQLERSKINLKIDQLAVDMKQRIKQSNSEQEAADLQLMLDQDEAMLEAEKDKFKEIGIWDIKNGTSTCYEESLCTVINYPTDQASK